MIIPTVTSVSPNSGPTAGGTSGHNYGHEFCCGSDGDLWGSRRNECGRRGRHHDHRDDSCWKRRCGHRHSNCWGAEWKSNERIHLPGAPHRDQRVARIHGSTAGGTSVTITGTNFAAGATVTFGSTPATNVVVTNSTTITATTPAGTAGAVTVTVTVGGQSGNLANGFTYTVITTISYVQGQLCDATVRSDQCAGHIHGGPDGGGSERSGGRLERHHRNR